VVLVVVEQVALHQLDLLMEPLISVVVEVVLELTLHLEPVETVVLELSLLDTQQKPRLQLELA
jgi:hypothetical protein